MDLQVAAVDEALDLVDDRAGGIGCRMDLDVVVIRAVRFTDDRLAEEFRCDAGRVAGLLAARARFTRILGERAEVVRREVGLVVGHDHAAEGAFHRPERSSSLPLDLLERGGPRRVAEARIGAGDLGDLGLLGRAGAAGMEYEVACRALLLMVGPLAGGLRL